MNKQVVRKQIRDKVRGYWKEFHKQKAFIPGKTKVPYAGRVYDNNEISGIVDAALDFWLTAGVMTSALEGKFKKYFRTKDFLLVNSGSSANLLMVASLCSRMFGGHLSPGDEVITPAVTFPTTVGPLVQYGLVPVFVDARVGTYNINEELIEKAVTKKTRALFIPHTLGNPCNMDIIMRVAGKKRLMVLEDSCDALGSIYGTRRVGTFGVMSSCSFYPAHHITLGEGGGVAVNDRRFVKIANSIRDWGRECYCSTGKSNSCGKRFSMKKGDLPFGYDHKYVYSNIGYNMKVTEMQSAVGLAQLEKLDAFEKARKRNFQRFYEGLTKYSDYLVLPNWHSKAEPSWFGFPVSVKKNIKRLSLIKWLEDRKIETRLMFGGNIVRQPAFKRIRHRVSGSLKNSDYIMNNTFFIGVYPGLTDEMIDFVLSSFDGFFNRN